MKRLTRAQRIEKEKAALRQRLWDMILGANGGYALPNVDGDEHGDLPGELGAEAWGQWIGAVMQEWRVRREVLPEFMFRPASLHHYFAELDEAVERLYEMGARA